MITIPEKFMGKSIKGAMKKILETSSPDASESPQSESVSLINLSNPEDYILLPGKTHRNYTYQDLLVSMYRLGISPEVEQAAQSLDFQVENTAKEQNHRDYIGNINWNQALTLNLSLKGLTLNLRQFADFLLLLKSGNAVNGRGERVLESKLAEILNEIVEVKEPWRSEWLDADFKYLDSNKKPVAENQTGEPYIYHTHELKNGILVPKYREKLESCLMKEGFVALQTMNKQGLPTEQGSDFRYCMPRKGNVSVARFCVYPFPATFYCGWIPKFSVSGLGVRLALKRSTQQ